MVVTDIFSPPPVDQTIHKCLRDRINGRGVLDQSSLKGSIVAKCHDATPRDVLEDLARPEEPGTAFRIRIVCPCVSRVAVQTVEEDVAAKSSCPQTSVYVSRDCVRSTYSTAVSPSTAPSKNSEAFLGNHRAVLLSVVVPVRTKWAITAEPQLPGCK